MSDDDRTQRRRPRVIHLDRPPHAPTAIAVDGPAQRDDTNVPPAGSASDASEARRTPRAVAAEDVRYEEDVFAAEIAAEEAVVLPPPARRGGGLLGIAVSSLLGLVGIALGLWIESLIARLFAMSPIAGLVGVALAVAFFAALAALAVRELLGMRRLVTRSELRAKAEEARAANDDKAARSIATQLAGMFEARPETARGRALLNSSEDDVMDARDRLALVEIHLLTPIDAEARRVILAGAKRVSLVTAVAPRALIDIAYVVLENARTVRAVATLYGVRPGRLGFLKLLRDVLSHLAVTGAIAVGDSVVGEAFGHGVASRISSRFGEGVVNGLLTARVGISAMDLCRPLPFHAVERPGVGDISREILTSSRQRKSLP